MHSSHAHRSKKTSPVKRISTFFGVLTLAVLSVFTGSKDSQIQSVESSQSEADFSSLFAVPTIPNAHADTTPGDGTGDGCSCGGGGDTGGDTSGGGSGCGGDAGGSGADAGDGCGNGACSC